MSEEENILAKAIADEMSKVLEADAIERRGERQAAEAHLLTQVKSSPWPKTVAGWLTLLTLVIAAMVGVAGFLSDYFDMRRKADAVPALQQEMRGMSKELDARAITIAALVKHTNDSEIHQTKWQKLEQIRQTINPLKDDSIARDRKIDSIQAQLKVATDGIKEIKETLKELRRN